jgi:ABC-type uncharacterized transport system permease subunit
MADDVIRGALLMTTPVLLAAMGGLVHRVSGVVNIGLDSMMLVGALVGLLISAAAASWPAAVLAAALMGAVMGLAMSLLITRLNADEIIVGLGFNVAFAGLVRFALKAGYGVSGTLTRPETVMLPRVDVPGLREMPILGAAISGHDPLTWIAWALVPLTGLTLASTRLGLRLRAAGAAVTVARALALRPLALRDGAGAFAGMLAGAAGAHLSIGVVGVFSEGITGGRGFLALAAFYFGRNRPLPTALGALLFGVFDAVQIRLQGRGVAAELVQTLPYLMVILVLTAMALAARRRPHGAAP